METSNSAPVPQDAAALVALDWGSTSLRAFLMDAAGGVIADRTSDDGASRLAGGPAEFEKALRRLVGDWLQAQPRVPLLACGMVGSQHGWREAPYAGCPVAVDALDRHSIVADGTDGLQVRIIPGVCFTADHHVADVMRGEETQIAGLLCTHPALAARCRVVLPGTHSKWVEVRDGCIVSFRTCMTGELFSLLREHSVLGRLMPPATDFHAEAFDEALQRARDDAGLGLSWDLFSVRARALMRQLETAALPDYLSGLLVGHEVAGALRAVPRDEPLALVGDPVLCDRYVRALRVLGHPATVIARNTAPQGLWRLGCRARQVAS
ncbi:MAG TPA: 2-dehydro-3-deoxygalactonokinase [Caldimonas sp.]|jgi:2-dehydro-3-deoxygalactonokinase